jgi:hypothetical protein
MTDEPKKYIHISEIGYLSDADWAEIESRDPQGPMLQYLGTVTRTEINLASVLASLAELEASYPPEWRKKIAAFMSMNRTTYDEFLRRVNPCDIDTTDMSTEQLVAMRFHGVQLFIDDTMPDGAIDIYNSDDEVIKECRL